MGYDFQIEYKEGKDNIPTDALSRSCYMAWSQPLCQIIEDIKLARATNPIFSKLIQGATPIEEIMSRFISKGGIICMGDRLVVPKDPQLIAKILWELHSSPIGGHEGIKRTAARVAANFYWQGMQQDIKAFINNYDIC